MDRAPTLAARMSQGALFHTIGELAERCGHYCWLERRLFALTGSRASDPEDNDPLDGCSDGSEAEARVLLSEMSFRHGLFAALWHERLPVRAGIDREALIVPPPGPAAAALDLLGDAPRLLVLKGLAERFLPTLLDAYAEHLAGASPVSEAPVRAVLEAVVVAGRREVLAVRVALQRLLLPGPGTEQGVELGARLQRALGTGGGVFPAAWAS